MKIKKLLSLFLAIFTMFFMVDGVNAANTSFEKSGLESGTTITKKGNLGYSIGETYDNTAYERENIPAINNTDYDYMHGSINVFGYENDKAYESSAIIQNGGKYYLTGIFPVYYIGADVEKVTITGTLEDVFKHLEYSNGKLTKTDGDLTINVEPSHVLKDRYIRLKYTVTNNSSTDTKTFSIGGYSDTSIDGNDANELKPTNNGFSLTNETKNIYVVTKNFTNYVTESRYWIGNRKTLGNADEYRKAFTNSQTFDKAVTDLDTAMSFSWIDLSIKPGETITKSILIGVGTDTPVIDVDGEAEYNLDNVNNVNVDIHYVVPTDGNAYKLYYKLNDGDVKTIDDADLTKAVAATKILDLINDEDLNKCGENTLTAWIGPSADSDFAKAVDSDEHKFTVTSTSCIPEKQEENPQSGVNTNYLILGLILAGGVGTYIYGRKHNKFPQV